ncbi:MAG: hypothetical protein JNJ59_09580 [Deltaproteobacteria bacterium]|nr:hypothetical protein [Deltaproteobacteria bacterium]
MPSFPRAPFRAHRLASHVGCVALAALVGAACRDAAAQAPCADAPPLASLGPALANWPDPVAPGLPGPSLLALYDGEADLPDRFVVDPNPLARGEHAGYLLERTPACGARLTPIPVVPRLEPSPSPPGDEAPLGDLDTDPTRAALLVTGPDPGADRDAYTTLFRNLGLRALHLSEPAPERVVTAIADTCARVQRGGLAFIALAGPGRGPQARADGADPTGLPSEASFMVRRGSATSPLAPNDALPFARIADAIATHCSDLGLVVLVLDTSFADALTLPSSAPPTFLVRASDATLALAPRLGPRGPGVLAQALDLAVARRRPAICATPDLRPRLDNAELAHVLTHANTSSDTLAATFREVRWQALGVPALAALDAAGTRTAVAEATLRRALDATPADLVGPIPPLPSGERCTTDAACDCALLACQRSACIDGFCRPVSAVDAPCDDADPCTTDDRCQADLTCVGRATTCDDQDPCTDDRCEPGVGCTASPSLDRPCDDRDACTDDDRCRLDPDGPPESAPTASCRGVAVTCDDDDPCTVDACDPSAPTSAEACSHTTVRDLVCDDGDACTTSDRCREGRCQGVAITCTDQNPCTADRCDPALGCASTPVADLVACDDGDACTAFDRCRQGVCRGLGAACDDSLDCTLDRCESGACRHLPAPGTCLTSTGCIAVGERPADAPCMVCEATDRLVPDPALEGQACADDGLSCTEDRCQDGRCRHVDRPDQCHDADGRCVSAGEDLTTCLVCQGGGVVTPAPAGSFCGGPPECAVGTCGATGRCNLPSPRPCCEPVVLTCGESWPVTWDAFRELPSRVGRWACDAEVATPGAERWLEVVAPCDGTLVVEVLTTPVDLSPALVALGAAPCSASAATCLALAPRHTLPVVAGQAVSLAVEAPSDPPGVEAYRVLTTRCECSE